MSTYSNLVTAAPDDMAELVLQAGYAFAHDPGSLSIFFRGLGPGYDAFKPAITAGRVVMERGGSSYAAVRMQAVAAVRGALP